MAAQDTEDIELCHISVISNLNTMAEDNMVPNSNAVSQDNILPNIAVIYEDEMLPSSSAIYEDEILPNIDAIHADKMLPGSSAIDEDEIRQNNHCAIHEDNILPHSSAICVDNRPPMANAITDEQMVSSNDVMHVQTVLSNAAVIAVENVDLLEIPVTAACNAVNDDAIHQRDQSLISNNTREKTHYSPNNNCTDNRNAVIDGQTIDPTQEDNDNPCSGNPANGVAQLASESKQSAGLEIKHRTYSITIQDEQQDHPRQRTPLKGKEMMTKQRSMHMMDDDDFLVPEDDNSTFFSKVSVPFLVVRSNCFIGTDGLSDEYRGVSH